MEPIYYHGLVYEPNCTNCPFRYQTKVLPDGLLPARRVLVGEGPGYQEREEGRGFVGPSGNLLWKLDGEYAGNPKREEHAWVTNATLCVPRNVRLTNGVTIDKETALERAVECCRPRLLWELRVVTQADPTAVIQPLGNWSLRSVTGNKKAKIYSYRGAVEQVDIVQLSETYAEPTRARGCPAWA